MTERVQSTLVRLGAGEQTTPAPQLVHAAVLEHRQVSDRYWFLRLEAPSIAQHALPGQFVMLTVSANASEDPVLPRPMAIYTTSPVHGTFDVMYGAVGAGTRKLTTVPRRSTMKVVGPLGRGFDLEPGVRRIGLVGRGIGTCSLTMLAHAAAQQGVAVVAVDSARTREALVGADAYRAANIESLIEVVDSDASSHPSAVAASLRKVFGSAPPDQLFTCGSNRLMDLCSRLGQTWGAQVQVSVEAHMACGLGYCHGCSSGQRVAEAEAPLVCKDGPVFRVHLDSA
jgi:dihydroorotate dehydrogenase electron transfer subunit